MASYMRPTAYNRSLPTQAHEHKDNSVIPFNYEFTQWTHQDHSLLFHTEKDHDQETET